MTDEQLLLFKNKITDRLLESLTSPHKDVELAHVDALNLLRALCKEVDNFLEHEREEIYVDLFGPRIGPKVARMV